MSVCVELGTGVVECGVVWCVPRSLLAAVHRPLACSRGKLDVPYTNAQRRCDAQKSHPPAVESLQAIHSLPLITRSPLLPPYTSRIILSASRPSQCESLQQLVPENEMRGVIATLFCCCFQLGSHCR